MNKKITRVLIGLLLVAAAGYGYNEFYEYKIRNNYNLFIDSLDRASLKTRRDILTCNKVTVITRQSSYDTIKLGIVKDKFDSALLSSRKLEIVYIDNEIALEIKDDLHKAAGLAGYTVVAILYTDAPSEALRWSLRNIVGRN
jgi:hypothetical protein